MDPDKVHVVHNGIDTELYAPDRDTDVLERPASTRTGRTWSSSAGSPGRRASGTCCAAAHDFDPEVQLVLCAGAPDTARDRRGDRGGGRRAAGARATAWSGSPEMLPRPDVSSCSRTRPLFVCPSVYEPLGHRQPGGDGLRDRGRRLAVGGIPEVVDDGETGLLVHVRRRRPGGVRGGLAEAVNALVTDPGRAAGDGPGRAGPGRSRSSAGTRSPAAPSRSTARCAEPGRRGVRYRRAAVGGAGGRGPTSPVNRGARRSRAASRPSSTSLVR